MNIALHKIVAISVDCSTELQCLQDLLTNVTGANETAHNAIARGEETLKKAKDLLERLKV